MYMNYACILITFTVMLGLIVSYSVCVRLGFSLRVRSVWDSVRGTGFHPILFIHAGNNDIHESSEEFEVRRDSTTDCGVNCPLASEKISIDL